MAPDNNYNCFIENNQEILLDFALQEKPEDKLMFAFSWHSYTAAYKPIKSLELCYTI